MSAADADMHTASIGWFRAVLSGVGILIIGILASVGVANVILTKATGLSRNAREYLASFVFFAVLFSLAWILRRLQARGLI